MNNDVTRTGNESAWALAPYAPGAPASPHEERAYTPGADLNLAALIRIVSEWRWLILSAIALGFAGAVILTLLTTPLYRADATLEANPPSVEILDEQSKAQAVGPSAWDFIATQVGLLESRSLAQRVAQDLNLASKDDFVGEGGNAESRLKTATSKVAGGLSVETPEEGQLIKISYVSLCHCKIYCKYCGCE